MSKKDISIITSLEDVYNLLKDEGVKLSDQYQYSHPKRTKGKLANLSIGRIWFNLMLPDNYPDLINEPVTKKLLYLVLNKIYNICSPEEASATLSLINKEAFKMSSIHPVTFDSSSFIVPSEIRKKKDDKINASTKPEDFAPALKELATDYLENHIKDTGTYDIIKSGAKGSAIDFGVLTIAKGPTIDIEGKVSDPITSALVDGYSGKEYYTAAAEARRSLYIRAVGTAEPGYLARHVTYANSNTLIAEEDCGTKKYLDLFIREDILPTVVGRFFLNERTNKLEEITQDHKDIINKMVKLRSPLYCKSETGLCKTCYGKLVNNLNTKHIGLIAGAVINAAGVEGYSMKMRHQSVQVSLKPVDFTKDMIQV